MTADEIARHIPPEALEAAAASICRDNGWPPSRAGACIEVARDACLAMLRAWPGMQRGAVRDPDQTCIMPEFPQVRVPAIILPLPQKETSA